MIGIYFLIKKKKIVYIGQTIHWPDRLYGHRDKDFDTTRFIKCDELMLRYYETRLIKLFRPELNKNVGGQTTVVRVPIWQIDDINKLIRGETTVEEILTSYGLTKEEQLLIKEKVAAKLRMKVA